jgi:cob(I)alamin adenosyltransferase
LAQEGWALCRQKILSSEYDLMVWDELTYPLKYGWLLWGEIGDRLEHCSTVMLVIFLVGVKAQREVEF